MEQETEKLLDITDTMVGTEVALRGLSSLLLAYAISDMHEPDAIKLASHLLDWEAEKIRAIRDKTLEAGD